jgi:hypothetical protein
MATKDGPPPPKPCGPFTASTFLTPAKSASCRLSLKTLVLEKDRVSTPPSPSMLLPATRITSVDASKVSSPLVPTTAMPAVTVTMNVLLPMGRLLKPGTVVSRKVAMSGLLERSEVS